MRLLYFVIHPWRLPWALFGSRHKWVKVGVGRFAHRRLTERTYRQWWVPLEWGGGPTDAAMRLGLLPTPAQEHPIRGPERRFYRKER